MRIERKYIWTIYILLWVYFIFFDNSYSQEDHISTFLILGWVPFAILSWVWRPKNNSFIPKDGIASFTQKLKFDILLSVLENPTIIQRAGVELEEYKKDRSKWSEETKKKWGEFFKEKGKNLDYEQTSFNLTYLASDNVFVVETCDQTYIVPVRTPSNNTYLFSNTLMFYPSKDKELKNEDIRLEVMLRDERIENKPYCLITVGLRKFKENKVMSESEYEKLFDFPFSIFYGRDVVSDEVYKKFGFKVERPSSWFDKDEFGKHTEHPWDTEINYKHSSGAEITWVN